MVNIVQNILKIFRLATNRAHNTRKAPNKSIIPEKSVNAPKAPDELLIKAPPIGEPVRTLRDNTISHGIFFRWKKPDHKRTQKSILPS